LIGLVRAVELFTQLVPGCRVTSKLEQWGTDGTQKQLSLPLAEVDSILGITIPPKTIEHILTDLEFTVKKTKTAFTVTVPPHRGDIHGARDLTEEVGRVYGYNDIPDVVPVAAINPPKRDMRIHALRDALKEHAFTEIVPISLVGSALLQKAGLDPSVAVEIRNPIGEELKLLHTSTLPGLLEHAQRNLLNASGQLRTFHLANVFTKQSAHKELGILITQLQSQNDGHALLHEPVLQLSSVLRQIFHPLGYEANVAAASSGASYAHPGRTADIFVRTLPASNDTDAGKPFTRVGMVCDVHPSVASSFDLPHRAAVALIDVDALLAVPAATLLASPVPQFPAVSYDQTETMRDTRSVGELLRQLRGSHEFLESVVVKDLYRAPNLPKEEYNLTLTFTYRAKDRTLTEDEAKGVHQKVLHAMMR
jgi:phenylalanyl-tRNA synthetase beta chain